MVATTTDNGANYVAAFRQFGAAEVAVEGQEEEDPEVVVGQPGNLHDQLDEVAPEVALHLPVHYRCGYVYLIINCYFNNIFFPTGLFCV